jgi:response regulator of citrate/malate metabolism
MPVHKRGLAEAEMIEIQETRLHANKQILLVEDEQAVAEIQRDLLTKFPCFHKADIASDGQKAIDMFEKKSYDFISLDYILPGQV